MSNATNSEGSMRGMRMRGKHWFLYFTKKFMVGVYRYYTCTHYVLGFIGLSVDRK